MKNVAALTIVLVSAAILVYAVAILSPRPQDFEYKVAKMVPEQRVQDQVVEIEIDGELRQVTVPVEYTVTRPVWENRVVAVLPTAADWLKFGIVLAFAIFIYLYMLVVLFWWSRNLSNEARESERVRDVRARLSGILGFALGIILGFVGGEYIIAPGSPISRTNLQSPTPSNVVPGLEGPPFRVDQPGYPSTPQSGA